jgi:hypothetical protein
MRNLLKILKLLRKRNKKNLKFILAKKIIKWLNFMKNINFLAVLGLVVKFARQMI